MEKPILAIMYDFDKTLSTTDMQNYSFIPNLGMTPDEFWGSTGIFSQENQVERILSYMFVMLKKAKEKGIKVTREYLNSCGKDIEFYPGVTTWFKRINKYGEDHGVQVEHYLVSSGTKEIVEGCKIYPFFTKAWGCEYYFDENGEPVWPKRAINYTQKTQFLFRITKGVDNDIDDAAVNKKSDGKHRVPYTNIAYLGDGMTDVACMTLVRKNGGKAIAIYPKAREMETVLGLHNDKRCDYIAKADYTEGSKMDRIIKHMIDKIEFNSLYDEKELELQAEK